MCVQTMSDTGTIKLIENQNGDAFLQQVAPMPLAAHAAAGP